MGYNLYVDAMHLVVRYLNSEDLKNASSTCRSWCQLIYEETQVIKGPRLVTQEIIINRYNRAVAKNNNVFFSTDIRPLLLLCFSNRDCNANVAKKLIAQLQPMHCIMAELKIGISKDVNTVWTIIIPSSCNLRVDTLYFVTKCRVPINTFRWIETREGRKSGFFTNHFQDLCSLAHYYNSIIYSAPFKKLVLIVFCIYSNIPELGDIIDQLSRWYPQAGPIWGCTLESTQAFCPGFNKEKPPELADIIQIYISGRDMLSRILVLNEDCNKKEEIQKKFENLKNEINLKKYSIAFMCTSVERYKKFYKIESAAFKQIFPEVTLAHIFSRRPFGAKSLYEFFIYLDDITPNEGNNITTILLLTYN